MELGGREVIFVDVFEDKEDIFEDEVNDGIASCAEEQVWTQYACLSFDQSCDSGIHQRHGSVITPCHE